MLYKYSHKIVLVEAYIEIMVVEGRRKIGLEVFGKKVKGVKFL
jgi:hypothetical protein